MTMNLSYDDYLAHYGVKGMKWGVRKDSPVRKTKSYVDRSKERYNKDRTRELRRVELTSKNGEKVVATEDRNPKFASFLTSISDKSYKDTLDNPSFSITADGTHVGESSLSKKDNGEINLVWLGVNPEHRGKGYASSVFDAAVEYGKSEGANKLTLEVPGNAPDARHIYEKRGFKVTKEADPSEAKKDIVWGGLTHMELDLKSPVLKHSNDADLELEKALEETFTKLPRDVEKEVFKNMSDVEQSDLDYDNYLAHYGIKGMRWGVRRKEGSDGNVGSGSGKVVSKDKSKMADSSEDGSSTTTVDNSARNKKIAKGAAIATVAVGAAIGGVAVKNVVDTKRINAGLAQAKKRSKMSLAELYLDTAPPPPKKPTRSNRAAKRDAKLYGDKGSKRIENAINRGQSPRAARNRETMRAGAKFAVKAGMNVAMSRRK